MDVLMIFVDLFFLRGPILMSFLSVWNTRNTHKAYDGEHHDSETYL